jgi:putative ABC transport system permease protein
LTMEVEATVPGRAVAPKTPAEFRADHARLGAIWSGFIERVREVPGVSSAAVAAMNPLSGWFRGVRIAIHGPVQGPEKVHGVSLNQVTDGYFEATGIRLLAGRSFTPRDRSGSLRVAILNETAARAFFGAETPLGRKVNFPGQRVQDEFEIVGIVADARYKDLRTPDQPMAYLPLEQAIDPITDVAVAVRGPGDLTRLVPSIRAIAAQTLPGGLVSGIMTMEQNVEMSLVRERVLALLATFFAALALILACIGLYGVMAYRVARRTREIGIRIAVGASHQSVVWMMVRETLLLVTIGAALGTLASLAANRYIAGQLFGVTPRDPVAIGLALTALAIVTMLAGYVPARQASRIDPVRALRAE